LTDPGRTVYGQSKSRQFSPRRGPSRRSLRSSGTSSVRPCFTRAPSWTMRAAGRSSFTWAPCATTARASCAPGSRHWLRFHRDYPQALALGRFLDRLDSTNQLCKTILYNLNPADNEMIGTMLGNFQDGLCPRKIQFGAAWWFLDQKDGMERQRQRFVGARLAFALRRHADRFAQLPVVLAARLLPPPAVHPCSATTWRTDSFPTTWTCWATWCRTSAFATPASILDSSG